MNLSPITLKTGRTIGKGYPTYIIAEIGSNHDGELERAKALIRAAAEAGADAAKFQSFQAETLINPLWKEGEKWTKDPSWKVLERLAVPEEWHHELAREAKSAGIDLLSTPFDLERLQLLLDLDIPAIKVASGDLTYHPLLRAVGKSGKPVLLSTGHANLGEVEGALKVLWETGCKDIALLHCASLYPSEFSDANIPAMVTMQQGFQMQVGYSDHTPGLTVPLGAVALGACVIEKHMTDDKTRSGPDHPFALSIEEFTEMAQEIRHLEEALSGGKKAPLLREEMQRIMARRSYYAREDIPEGTVIRSENVKCVRHAYPEGISADRWDRLNGKRVKVFIKKNTLITREMV